MTPPTQPPRQPPTQSPTQPRCNIAVAYMLWCVGGVWGAHQFYLRRDHHALLWYCTCGGAVVGWARDALRIPEYVAAANGDREYYEELKEHIKRHRKPPFNSNRFVAELVLGLLFGFLTKAVIPEDVLSNKVLYVLVEASTPYAVALGIYLVANIGHEECSLRAALLGAYVTSPLLVMSSSNISYTALCCALYVNHKSVRWRRRPHPHHHRSTTTRAAALLLCCTIYTGMWTSVLLYNAYVTTSFGEKVLLKDAVHHFIRSPAWEETKETCQRLWLVYLEQGIGALWKELVAALDPQGEAHAYKVLGLPTSATEEEVRQHYKQLIKEWHPDKHKDEKMKQVAEQRFIEIQEAYEMLSEIRAKRTAQNMKIPQR